MDWLTTDAFKWVANIPARYVWTFLTVVFVTIFYQVAFRLLRRVLSHQKRTTPFVILHRVLLWTSVLVGGLLVLQALGVLEAAWTTLTAAITLVAVGFVAMWSVLSHATCAVVMMLARPFDIGDKLEFPETPNIRGEVVDFTLIYTSLRTDTGDLIQIPNNTFFQRIVKRQKGEIEITLEEQFNRDDTLEERPSS